MKRVLYQLSDYGNAWMGQSFGIDVYSKGLGKGSSEDIKNGLKLIKSHVESPIEYQKSYKITYIPDFTFSQRHRMNYLAEMCNHESSDENPDIDRLQSLYGRTMILLRKWDAENQKGK